MDFKGEKAMKIQTERFYLSIDRYGFTLAIMIREWDIELHFHFWRFNEE